MPAGVNPAVYWRLVLCDLWGNALSIITPIASDLELDFKLNRPASCTFNVPSEDSMVNTLYRTTGEPWLRTGNRIVKAYRKLVKDEPGGWELRFVGRVWGLEDSGDGDTCRTSVTCYDALMDLQARVVRRKDGTFGKQANFYNVKGSDIVFRMIDRSNAFGATPTLISLNEAYFTDTSPLFESYDQAMILPSLYTITDTGTIDLLPTNFSGDVGFYPDFSDPDFSDPWPIHMVLGASPKRGQDRRRTVIGYAGPPRNAVSYNRTQSMDTFANDITFWGKSVHGWKTHNEDSASQNKYGAFEAAEVLPDIQHRELVEALGAEALALRKLPRDIVSFVPSPERTVSPFVEFHLGDLITVNAATIPNPVTREAVEGVQRVYGFHVSVDDDYGEQITELSVSGDAES